jgi:hypothetical protein
MQATKRAPCVELKQIYYLGEGWQLRGGKGIRVKLPFPIPKIAKQVISRLCFQMFQSIEISATCFSKKKLPERYKFDWMFQSNY